MAKLPNMAYNDRIAKSVHVTFAGYNHTPGARNGDLWDMQNLTSSEYPLLAPRMPRYTERVLEKPNGIYSFDGKFWVDGTNFYANGEVVGAVSNSVKQFATLGRYVVILPDWKYYDREAGTMGSIWETENMSANYVNFELRRNDTEYTATYALYIYTDTPGELVDLTVRDHIDLSLSGNVRQSYWQKARYSVSIKNGTVAGVDLDAYPQIVAISGGDIEYTISPSSFAEDPFGLVVNDSQKIGITTVGAGFQPEAMFECNNRLWACYGDTIRASALGDIFSWETYEGLSTDSWAVDVGSAGDFTGGCNYRGYPTFFKEDRVYRVYGSYPEQYSLVETATIGLDRGSARSLVTVGEVLYYLSPNGVTAYSGGTPQIVSQALGNVRYRNAVGGTDGRKYYISMVDNGGDWHLFVYDTMLGLWHREDSTQAVSMAYQDGLYISDAAGAVFVNGDSKEIPPEAAKEQEVISAAEFADFIEGPGADGGIHSAQPNIKGVSKVQIRLEVDEGAEVEIYIQYDSSGDWELIKTLSPEVKRSYYIPVIPRRCDHFRFRFDAVGYWRLHSLTFESYTGSELYR